MSEHFTFNSMPKLIFGRGQFDRLPEALAHRTGSVLVISDGYGAHDQTLIKSLEKSGFTPELISLHDHDAILEEPKADLVISIGAGRAIDAGKKIAKGRFHLAIPTTHGTGSAMNDMIFRDQMRSLVTPERAGLADVVLADPRFIDDMTRAEFAARGLGVFMVLLEGYVSARACVMSDCLIWSGLEAFSSGFIDGLEGTEHGRDQVFYASLMGGVASGQLGFGLCHRLAIRFEESQTLTYGEIMASLSAEICNAQIEALNDRLPDSPALDKYAMVGELLAGRPFEDREEAYTSLIGTLRRWVARLEFPRLEVDHAFLETILKDMCKSPLAEGSVTLFKEELSEALSRRLKVMG